MQDKSNDIVNEMQKDDKRRSSDDVRSRASFDSGDSDKEDADPLASVERSADERAEPEEEASATECKNRGGIFVWSLSEGGVNPSPTARELVGTRS